MHQNTENSRLRPCPSCGKRGNDLDPSFWKDGAGTTGPGCLKCGTTCRSIFDWNRRDIEDQLLEVIDILLAYQDSMHPSDVYAAKVAPENAEYPLE